jgi:hypothetical protein
MSRSLSGDGRDRAARALRTLERHAGAGVEVARSVYDRWRAPRPPARFAGTPDGRAPAVRADADPGASAAAEGAAPSDLSENEVRDLRAELERELERLAGADIEASRGDGRPAGGETPDRLRE